MIITRTPLRITLGGGGTDLPSYYRRNGGGYLIAAAITKYVFIAVNHNFDGDLLLKYSSVERVAGTRRRAASTAPRDPPRDAGHRRHRDLVDGRHPRGYRARFVGRVHGGRVEGARSRTSTSWRRTRELAELACEIEIDRLGEPIGKQDQYIAAFGGITAFEFRPDDAVEIDQPRAPPATRGTRSHDNLLLFYTGIRRAASDVLAVEQTADVGGGGLDANLDAVKALGRETTAALQAGDARPVRRAAHRAMGHEARAVAHPDPQAGRRVDPRRHRARRGRRQARRRRRRRVPALLRRGEDRRARRDGRAVA